MPNLNDEALKPVSFIRGGFTHGGQVHLEGTFGYLPEALADLDDDEQIDELGNVYWRPGIRRGYTPASESYLSGEYQRRISSDMENELSAKKRLKAEATERGLEFDEDAPLPEGARIIEGHHSAEIRPVNPTNVEYDNTGGHPGHVGGVDPQSGEVPSGYTLQNPVTAEDIEERQEGSSDRFGTSEGGTGRVPSGLANRDEEGALPVHDELSKATIDAGLTPEEKAKADEIRETQYPVAQGIEGEPFPGAYAANIGETREWLASASDDDVTTFIAWEKARDDKSPRVTLLRELGEDV